MCEDLLGTSTDECRIIIFKKTHAYARPLRTFRGGAGMLRRGGSLLHGGSNHRSYSIKKKRRHVENSRGM